MHVKSLKVFCDVVGRRSFSRAADENGISQSGASQMVHQLEERLGVRLIDRSKRPFVLTSEGEVYYEGCRKLVKRLSALEEEVRTLHQDVDGRVSVASIYSVGLSHMNQCVKDFLAQFPKANVRIEYQHPDRVYELVECEQVDFGLVSFPKPTRSLQVTAWRQETMSLVCAPEHDLAGASQISLGELEGRDLVGFDENLRIRREIDRALAASGAEAQVVMAFDNIETIKRAIEINAGIGLLPRSTVEKEVTSGTLVSVPIETPGLVRPLGIITRRGKHLGRTARRFLDMLHERAGSNGVATNGTISNGTSPNATPENGVPRPTGV